MKERKLKKWAAAALSAAMALGMYSVPALAEGGNTEDLKQLAISGVNYYYADTQGDAADTVYQASVTTGRGASAVTKVYDFSKSDLTQVTGTEYYYTVISGTTPLTGTLYGYKSGTGTATTYQQVYGNLGAHADSSYDVISSATKFSGHHAKDIPSLVTFGKDGSGDKAITGLTLGRSSESVSALDYVEGSILNDAGAALSAQQTEALAVQLKANPMSAPNGSAVTPAVGSASYTTSRYGAGEFVISPDDTVDGYVWSEYWSNVYAATISDGKNTVGAVHWIDLYGEAAVSGPHYNKIQIAVNNGISPASNQAQVSRYADFFDTDTGALKPGTYTIKVYAEGYDVLTATVVLPEYVLMNIPYSKFYGSEGVENVDVVSSATLKNLNQGLAPGSYHDGYIYTEDEAKGATVQGVAYPVRVSDAAVLGSLKKVSAEDKAEITVATGKSSVGNQEAQGAALLFASGDYAYYVLEEEPGNYKELSGTSKDNFAFSEVKKAAESASGMTVNVGYTGHHTNIEFIVDADGLSDATVTAVTVTADGKKYALRHIEEIWRNVQLGWNWTDIDGAGLGGKTVTNVTYYMRGADGSYRVRSYDVNAYIKPKMAGEQTAAFTNRKNIQITGLADDIAGAKATVKTVVGRGQTPTVIAENADVVGGKVALTDAAVFDTNYAISVVSDNYADISVQAECKDTRADGSVTGTASYEKTVGDEAFVLDAKSDQSLTYTSSDENVVTVDNAGKVSIAGEGSAQITVTAAETDDVKAAELIVTVSVKKAAEPEQPSQPETGKPAEPEQPSQPETNKPAEPEQPSQPETNKPSETDKTSQPGTDKPSETDKSSKPETDKPSQPAATDKSAEQGQPTQSGTDKTAEPDNQAVASAVAVGRTYTAGKMKYKVTGTDSSGTGKVTITGTTKKKSTLKNLTIPDTVTINGEKLKVTAIKAGAFKGFKKLRKVTIGANIETIGKKAFYGDKKLKSIKIKSKVLKSVGKKSFKKIAKKAKFKVPKAQKKAYKKLFKKSTGFTKKMKIR